MTTRFPLGDDASGPLLPGIPALAERSPEARLALAVLEDAVSTYVAARRLSGPGAARIARAEWTWISERGSPWPFAFEALCHHVGLDPDGVRARLARRFGELPPEPLVTRRVRRRHAPSSTRRPR